MYLSNFTSDAKVEKGRYAEELIEKLKSKARKVRIEIVKSIYKAQSGHPGGSLSATDILVALFFYKMHFHPKDLHWKDRDLFVLSKGHGVPALYGVFSELGIIKEEELSHLRQVGSILQGHPDRLKTPGIEASTGSLGQGLSIALGMALSIRLNKSNRKVYVMMGDGEMQEGQIWEAMLKAGNEKLDNLVGIIDYNGIQLDGMVKKIDDLAPLKDKCKAFKWETVEIDGHNFDEILWAFDEADKNKGRPFMIIAHTIKGKGVSFMENNPAFHGKAPNEEQYKQALKELGATE